MDVCGSRLDACGVAQGVNLQYFPYTFVAVLRFVEEMRKGQAIEKQFMDGKKRPALIARRPVKYISLSRTDLPDSMVQRLVAAILLLPPKPKDREMNEILELQKVAKTISCFRRQTLKRICRRCRSRPRRCASCARRASTGAWSCGGRRSIWSTFPPSSDTGRRDRPAPPRPAADRGLCFRRERRSAARRGGGTALCALERRLCFRRPRQRGI